MKAEKNCEAFKQACEAGRVDKYIIDLGWGQHLFCFIVYCNSGNSIDAKEESEAIACAIEEEIGKDSNMPIVIQVNFNWEPRDLDTFRNMLEEKSMD